MTTHQFDVEIAQIYGIHEAILLQNIAFWIQKNAANNKQIYDGNVWTYNSVKAFSELFPYMSEKQIYNALKKLESEGLIVTGNYNKSAYDRTKWYALTDKASSILGISIFPTGKIEMQNLENQNSLEGEPIPDINTDNKPDSKKKGASAPKEKRERFSAPSVQEIKDYTRETGKPDYSEQFWNYYESNGWLVGKNKMKSWKAAYAGWCSRQDKFNSSKQTSKQVPKYTMTAEESHRKAWEQLNGVGDYENTWAIENGYI
jgi:DNA-binding PadR family transcriptional regulator